MAADFRINLAKDMTSTEEDRVRFYNGMLIYLVICAAAMVFTAYLSSVNIVRYVQNNRECSHLLSTVCSVSGLEASSFKDPGETYAALEDYSRRIESLRQALGRRVQLLPVVHNLFVDLPDGMVLQSLSANKSKLAFGLSMPPPSEQSGDPVRDLRSAWEKNDELMKRVASIRPVTGERRTIGTQSIFYVQFECILKK